MAKKKETSVRITDYLGNTVNVQKPKSSAASVSGRSYDMEKAYFTEGITFESATQAEVEDKYRRWMATKDECFYCGRHTDQRLERDHLVPNRHTGESGGIMVAHTIHEFIPCCSECNGGKGKGNREPLEWYTDPETVRHLKSVGLSDERYQAKLEALKYDLEHLKYYVVKEAAYEQAERDLAIKDNMTDLLEKFALERNLGILQDNGEDLTVAKKRKLPTEADRIVWKAFEDALIQAGRMKRVDRKGRPEEEDPLF